MASANFLRGDPQQQVVYDSESGWIPLKVPATYSRLNIFP